MTGKIFEEKDLKEYAIHLRTLRTERAEKRKLDKVRATFTAWLNREKKKILKPEDIPAWFLKNQRKIMDAANAGFGGRVFRSDKFFETDKFTKFEFDTPRYSRLASNSHSCPKGGVTNWSNEDKGKPTGYPGWNLRVGGILKRDKKHMGSYPYSAAMHAVGIHTHSGGGGNENWGYDATIFLSEWSGLQAAVDEMEQDQMVKILKGQL